MPMLVDDYLNVLQKKGGGGGGGKGHDPTTL